MTPDQRQRWDHAKRTLSQYGMTHVAEELFAEQDAEIARLMDIVNRTVNGVVVLDLRAASPRPSSPSQGVDSASAATKET
jgi:hypothetical protein